MSDTAFKTALYVALDAALAVPVYDHVPQGSAMPYVVIDGMASDNAEFLNARKDEITALLSVWSTYSGQNEVLGIMAEIDTALHGNRLTLTSGRLASLRVVSRETSREPDGETYMGRVTITALMESE